MKMTGSIIAPAGKNSIKNKKNKNYRLAGPFATALYLCWQQEGWPHHYAVLQVVQRADPTLDQHLKV